MKLQFSEQILRKKLKYYVSSKSVQWEPSCSMRTDGRTDTIKLIVAFRNFANAPNNVGVTYVSSRPQPIGWQMARAVI